MFRVSVEFTFSVEHMYTCAFVWGVPLSQCGADVNDDNRDNGVSW